MKAVKPISLNPLVCPDGYKPFLTNPIGSSLGDMLCAPVGELFALDHNGILPPRALTITCTAGTYGGDNVTNPNPSVTWEKGIDFASQALNFLRTGGSFNFTSGPYLSDVSVAPARPQASIPWLPIIGIVGGLSLLIWVVKD